MTWISGVESLSSESERASSEACGGAHAQLALQLFAFRRYVAGLLFGLKHVECVTGLGSAVKTEDEHGSGRTGFLNALVSLVEHGLDLAVVCTGQDYVADTECTVLYEHGGHIAASFVERRLYD